MSEKTIKELRVEAEALGIDVPGNISKVKLKAKIDKVRSAINEPVVDPEKEVIEPEIDPIVKQRNEMRKLMRVRITCHDPQFKKHTGVIRAAGSTVFFIRRFVPFNRPTHIEKVLYDFMKRAQFQWFEEKTNRATGRKYKVPRSSPAFVIEDLPALTKEELEELARDQQARGAIDDNDY